MQVDFLQEAKYELMDTVLSYERELVGLGLRFWDEVDRHVEWVRSNYELPPVRPGGYRRVNLSVFPYYMP